MQGGYLAEMKTVDGKCDRQWEQAWTPEQSPEKEPPVLDAFDAANTQLVNGSPQGQDILRLQLDSDFGWLVFAKKCQNALVIEFGRIDLVQGSCDNLPAAVPMPILGMMLVEPSTLSPENSFTRRPSFCMRSYRRVPKGACSNPTMAVTMPLF